MSTFKMFPQFSKVTLADREKYEALTKDYPPLSELSFATLMLWWNHLDSLAIAELNGGLVISYWLLGDEDHSGLCFVGKDNIDEAFCSIFDYLNSEGAPCRLVHVPEFVIQNLRYPEMFKFTEERDYDEYLAPVRRAYPLSNLPFFKRKKIRQFLRETGPEKIMVKSLDLSEQDNVDMLLRCADSWQRKSLVNKKLQQEEESMNLAATQSHALGIENVCLFIDGVLEAFCLYYRPPANKNYVILSRARCNDEVSGLFDYMVYAFAEWFFDHDIERVNLDSDLGKAHLRALKLVLGPTNFFRKYTVTPIS